MNRDLYRTAEGGIVGYRCGGQQLSTTTISLLDTPDCLNEKLEPEYKPVKIAITQTNVLEQIKFVRCHGTLSHLITRCGKSIDQIQHNALQSELVVFDSTMCNTLVKSGYFITASQNIPNIKGEIGTGTLFSSFVTSGSVDASTGSCTPGPDVTINSVQYTRPLINSAVKISYSHGMAQVDLERKQVIFSNGARCNYESQACHHADYGYLFWDLKLPVCEDQVEGLKSLIYLGSAYQFDLIENGIKETFIQANSGDYEFQLKLSKKTTEICGHVTSLTEHPRLFVTILPREFSSFPLKKYNTIEANLLLYINSKLLYSLRHTKTEVMKLFRIFQLERCKMQNRISENMLTLALLSPRDFAYQYFSSPGYTAVTRGEVVHIAKCEPVIVLPDPSLGNCYNELPVIFNNQSWFLTPRSRILVKNGKIVECTPTMTSQFFINKWVTLTNTGLMRVETPKILSNENITYDFEVLTSLASGGLYTKETLDKMQKTLISPYEESIISSRIVSALQGVSSLPMDYQFSNGFSLSDLNMIKEKIETRWEWLLRKIGSFGNICSTLIGVIILIKCSCHIVDSMVNFFLLKREKGLLIALLCFWWTSCTHHVLNDQLIFLKKQRKNENIEEQPLKPLNITRLS